MRPTNLFTLSTLISLAACAGAPDTIEVRLAPAVISSLDGTTTVSAIVADATTPLDGVAVHIAIDYTDRNGTPHTISPVDGTTDQRGVFTTALAGLDFDGIGKVTVTHGAVTGEATFSVLDRTPPKITILPPTTDLKVGAGLPLDVQVHVTDEIGVSTVTLDATGGISGGRTTLLASGTQDATLTFRLEVDPNAVVGPSIHLFALANDLSGNLVAAIPVELIVDPAISIATVPGLHGSVLVDGTQTQLTDPRSIVASTKDGKLYVADRANTGVCQPSCVWRVDATTGAIDSTPVYVGQGTVEGVAVDGTSDHLYVSDRQNRIVQLTWSALTNSYGTPAVCIDVANQQPADPFHLVVDATLGLLVPDDNDRNVQKVAAACVPTNNGVAVSAVDSFDKPRGIALDPTGAIYVSDIGTDRISKVNRTTGVVTVFDGTLNAPYGVEWLAGGTSIFKDSLMVAAGGDRIIASTRGAGSVAAAYLRLPPIDLTFIGGTMFAAAQRDGNVTHGRIYKITGF